jgi:alpha/beta superfamily hydrolase
MKEEKIYFPCGNLELEGLFHEGPSEKGVAVTHPHPLYGGDMFSPVVEAIASAYQKRGFATLRFNFRGTGNSTGTHDQGIGERVDVAGAVDFLNRNGCREIHLSGYSFGAWVNAMAVQDMMPVEDLTMVAPPVAFIPFDDEIRLPTLSGVVAGSRDEFAPPELIRPLMNQWNPNAKISVIDGADHFLFGFLDAVSRILIGFIT